MENFWKMSTETKTVYGIKLTQIELTIDCKWGKKGDKGGWIAKKENLQYKNIEDGFCYCGEIRGGVIYGGVIRGGVIRGGVIYGGEWQTSPFQIQGTRNFINISRPGFLQIGCLEKSLKDWKKEYIKIGENNNYSKTEIEEYGLYIDLAIALEKLNKTKIGC